MRIEDVLTKNEKMLLEKFVKDNNEFEAVRKALLLYFYFNKGETNLLKKSFTNLQEIMDNKERDKNKGRNPAI